MKKEIKLFLLLVIIFIFSGCSTDFGLNKDSMEDIQVYTSLYPTEYVSKKLYGDNAKISSMYPLGVNPYEYKLTKKQIEDYGNSDLIIYNGLTSEKDMIVNMINKNQKLKIIDATARIEYNYGVDEIWLNPSNLLTVAQNIRNGLKEYINSEYLKKTIDKNYDKLNLELSKLDANIKEDVANAKYRTIITTSDNLKVLEKYDLTVYSLDDKSITDKIYNDIVKLISSNQIKYIYTTKDTENNELLKKLKSSYSSLEIIEINTLNNISDEDNKNSDDYLSIMNENRNKLKKELYK